MERHARADSVGDLPPPGQAEPGQGGLDEDGHGHAAAAVPHVPAASGQSGATARLALVRISADGTAGSARTVRVGPAAAELHRLGRSFRCLPLRSIRFAVRRVALQWAVAVLAGNPDWIADGRIVTRPVEKCNTTRSGWVSAGATAGSRWCVATDDQAGSERGS